MDPLIKHAQAKRMLVPIGADRAESYSRWTKRLIITMVEDASLYLL